jgi:subtilisin-like proprotein convertase family protein
MAATPSSGRQLRLVQFNGPIKPAWFAGLASQGTVVTYIPDNAYLVWTTGSGAAALDRQADTTAYTVYSGPFDPYYRLAPALRGKELRDQKQVDVTVQAVSGADGDAALASVTDGRDVAVPIYDLGGLVTTSLRVPVAELEEIASLAPVVNVEPYAAPEMNDEAQDQLLAGNVQTVGGKTVPTGPGYLTWLAGKGFPTTPTSYPKVVVVDDGIDTGTTTPLHQDFYQLGSNGNPSRLLTNNNCTTDATANAVGGHGNLNAGIVGGYNNGAGVANADANGYHYGLGVSPYGRLGGEKIFTNAGAYSISNCAGTDAGVVANAFAAGAGLTSNSWGANVGGAYDASARNYDILTRDASAATGGNQEMLHVFSAGNAGGGANTIGSPGTAKNVLTIGATENVRDQGTLDGCGLPDGDNDSDIATFSSRGPTDDGRVKPDLVAAGTHVQGPASQDPGYDGSGVCGSTAPSPGNRYYPAGQTLYTWSSGTSHSAPAVSGAASLVQNYYGRVLTAGATASPAMLKALLANTPRYLSGLSSGDVLPSNSQGYGVPNLDALFETAPHRVLVDETQVLTASGQQLARVGNVANAAKPVRVTLAWSDAPGPTVGNAYVNNLDLVVTAGGQTYRGNVFGSNGLSAIGGTADGKDNVENVFLPAGTTGPISVRVVGTNIAGDGVPGVGGALDQDFALTASNMDLASQAVAGANGITYAESDFDGNTTVDPGEVVNVSASIMNSGDLPLGAGTGTLTVASGPATVLQGSSTYAAIAAGQTDTNQQTYQIRVDPSPNCATPVVLDHTYTSGAQTVVQHLTIVLGSPPPVVSYNSADIPKAIPDNNAAGVNSTLVVLATTDKIGKLKVRLNITHTFDGDLSAKVTTPSGAVLTLFSRIGGSGNSGDNLTGTAFSDSAAAAPAAGGAPYTGTFKPVTLFATVDNQPVTGTWTLNVSDNAAIDVGNLTSWGIDNVPSLAGVCGGAAGPSVRITPPAPVGEGSNLDVPVTLLSPDAAAHSVTFTPSNGTASAPADFDATPITVTWNPGDPATQHLSIPVVADALVEPEETFTIAATASTIPVSAAVTARILPVAPLISVAASAAVVEGAGGLSFPVTLANPDPGTTYTVHVATGGGTATAGADYTSVNQTLTWAPGDPVTKNVSVTVLDDSIDEPAETVTLTLTAPTNAALGTAAASGTINDNDAVSISVTDAAAVTEGSGSLSFPVAITGANPAASYSVHIATTGGTATAGTDYTAVSQTLTWIAGDTAAKNVSVPVLDDSLSEAAETVVVTLDTPTGGSPDVALGSATGGGTINDDDSVHLAIADATNVTEGGSLQFPVTLTGAGTGQTYTVHVDTSGGTATSGTDYAPVSATLTWAPGDPATKNVTVATTQDTADEPDETVGVALSAATGGFGTVVVDRAAATGTILDDDQPPTVALPVVAVKKAKVTEGDKGKRKLTFQVTLSKASVTPVTFQWKTQDLTATAGKDYKKGSGTLIIPAGSTTATITVLVKGDKLDERNEKLSLICSNILNGIFGGKTTVKGKIVDVD